MTTATQRAPLGRSRAINGGNLAHGAYGAIRKMILSRQIMGGDILSEERLAAELAISRTPVREALLLLQNAGLIQKEVNQPFRVRLVSNREYFQSMRLRELLEGEAIGMAIGKIPLTALAEAEEEMLALKAKPQLPAEAHWAADERLHEMIADASGSDVMANVIRDLRVTTRLFELSGLPSRFRPDTEEHLHIIDSVRTGDPKIAQDSIRGHIRSLANDVLDFMAKM